MMQFPFSDVCVTSGRHMQRSCTLTLLQHSSTECVFDVIVSLQAQKPARQQQQQGCTPVAALQGLLQGAQQQEAAAHQLQ
jgi:hypothetical protein